MNARDELAEIMEDVIVADRAIRLGLVAAAILAAGYRKPRTITTAEELESAPMGIVVREPLGLIWEKTGDGEGGVFWIETGDEAEYQASEIELPATVLYESSQP